MPTLGASWHPFLRSTLNLSPFLFFFFLVFLSPFIFQPLSKRIKLSYRVPDWERTDSFDPLSIKYNSIHWVHHDGKALDPSPQSPQPYNAHLSSDWINSVIRGVFAADVTMLAFPDPATFLAGQLHDHLQAWIDLTGSTSYPLSQTVLDWLANKVQVHRYFKHFTGNFKGEQFDSPSPPKRVFYNHISCAPFAKFISDTILQRLATGATSV